MSVARAPALVPVFAGAGIRRYQAATQVAAAPPGTDAILDEAGNPILDEAGNSIEDEAGP